MKVHFIDPAKDFSDGLEVIRTYHDNLLEHGCTLLDLVGEIEDQGINAERANRLAELYAYYQRANTLHHQDEERALFPAVIGKDLLIDGMIERLTLDHEEIEEAWRVLEIALKDILDCHPFPEQLQEKAARFVECHSGHLLRENEDFLPRIAEILNGTQRRAIGQVMEAMRGMQHGL